MRLAHPLATRSRQEALPDDPRDGLYGAARLRAMFAVAMSVLLCTLDYSVANVALPTIAHDIHSTPADSIWVINAYQLASLIGLLPLAALGEITGQDRMCRVGLMVFIVASACCAGSQTLLQLSVSRVLQGVGGACVMSVNGALVRFIYPSRLLGRGIAINGLVVALGVALGPTIAAAVLSVAGWRWIFLINLPLGAAALAFAATSLPVMPRAGAERRFDGLSAVLLAASLGPLVAGFDRLAHQASLGVSLLLILVGLGCFAWLLRRQIEAPAPMLPIDLLRLSEFRGAFVVGFLAFVASNFFMIAMPFFFETELHRTAVQTGLLMTAWPLAIVLVSPLVARIADHYSAGLLSSLGLLVTGSGFLLVWLMPHRPGDADVLWRIALAASGFALFQPPNNRAILTSAPKHRSGSASGMMSVSRLLGQTIGAMLVASVLDLVQVDAPRSSVGFGAAVALVGAAISASRLRPKARPRG